MRYAICLFMCVWASLTAHSPQDTPVLPIQASHQTLVLLDQANQHLDAALYFQAVPLFQQVFENPDSESVLESTHGPDAYRKVRYSLAQALFFSENYNGVIEMLSKQSNLTPKEQLLLAISYRKMGQFENSAHILNTNLSQSPTSPAHMRDRAQFELALTYFFWKKLPLAQDHFTQLLSKSNRFAKLSELYLARIALLEHHAQDAYKRLQLLERNILEDDILRYELYYLLGTAVFQMHNYAEAAQYLEKATPLHHAQNSPWASETQYLLGWCYLKLADNPNLDRATQTKYFQLAESILQTLLEEKLDERTLLALGQCYLAKALTLNDNSAFEHAEILLTRRDIPLSREAQAHVLLLRAEATPTFATRDALYRRLTHEMPLYAKGWYLRGLNDLETGRSLLNSNQPEEASNAFQKAFLSFEEAFSLMKTADKSCAALSLKCQSQALYLQNTPEKQLQALKLLEKILTEMPEHLNSLDDPDEIYYLYAITAARIAESDNEKQLWIAAEQALRNGLKQYPNGKFVDSMLLLLGTLYYQQQQDEMAENTFVDLAIKRPNSARTGEALFWAARCADRQHNFDKSKEYRRQIFEKHPDSSFAPEAYFTYYSYPEYLQGDRTAIKHLDSFPSKYSDATFLIHAKFLIGLDLKRDRKTAEGKWIRKKNLTASIDAFQEAEAAFDLLNARRGISEQDFDSLLTLRYRANLERALANFAIAEESEGAKQQIYLEYAQEVLLKLCDDFRNQENPLYSRLNSIEACHRIQEESTYWLSQAYLKESKETEAQEILALMLENYKSAKITRGYFLSRAWYEKGMIALRHSEYQQALDYLKKSEEAAKGNILDTEQRLDLWIQQSMCYRALHDLDNAILLLSKAINDDAISGLRIKAMYLRAEMYAQQNRYDLARRQLEATSKKGGEWARKAKAALERL